MRIARRRDRAWNLANSSALGRGAALHVPIHPSIHRAIRLGPAPGFQGAGCGARPRRHSPMGATPPLHPQRRGRPRRRMGGRLTPRPRRPDRRTPRTGSSKGPFCSHRRRPAGGDASIVGFALRGRSPVGERHRRPTVASCRHSALNLILRRCAIRELGSRFVTAASLYAEPY